MSKFKAKHYQFLVLGYVTTIFTSVAFSDIPALSQLVPIAWFLVASRYLWLHGVNGESSTRQHALTALALQLPGMVCAVVSLWSVFEDSTFQWANGLLELWCYPFLSLFELLPEKRPMHVSDVYLMSCMLPFFLFGLFVVIPWLGNKRGRHHIT